MLMDQKNVTFCVHELKLSCPDQGLTSWLPDWTNKLIAGVELSCTQTPGHRLSLRTGRCFFSSLRTKPSETRGLAGCCTNGGADHLDPHVHCVRLTDYSVVMFVTVWHPTSACSVTNLQKTVFMSPPAVRDSPTAVRSSIGGCDITQVISRLSLRLRRDERLRGVFDVTEVQRALACNLPSRHGVCFHLPPPHLDARCFQLHVTTAAFTHLCPAVSTCARAAATLCVCLSSGGGAFDVRCLVRGGAH